MVVYPAVGDQQNYESVTLSALKYKDGMCGRRRSSPELCFRETSCQGCFGSLNNVLTLLVVFNIRRRFSFTECAVCSLLLSPDEQFDKLQHERQQSIRKQMACVHENRGKH